MMLFRRTALVALLVALACVVVSAANPNTYYNDLYENTDSGYCYDSTPFVRFQGQSEHDALATSLGSGGAASVCAYVRLPTPTTSNGAVVLFTIGDNEVLVTNSANSASRVVISNSVDQQFASTADNALTADLYGKWNTWCVVVGSQQIKVFINGNGDSPVVSSWANYVFSPSVNIAKLPFAYEPTDQPFSYVDVDHVRFFDSELSAAQINGALPDADLVFNFDALVEGKFVDTTGATSWDLLAADAATSMAAQSDPAKDDAARIFQVSCPVACTPKNDWKASGSCSVSCGAGTVTEKSTKNAAQFGGKDCDDADLTRVSVCDTGVVCPVNCVPEDTFGAYGSCSVTCGTGIKTRMRGIKIKKAGTGTDCSASDLSQSTSCDTGVVCPVDCKVSDFSAYGACSKTCGGGSQTSSRTVTTSPKGTGTACPSLTQSRTCNTAACTPACGYQLPPTLSSGGYSVSGTGTGQLGEVLTLSCNSGFLFLNVPKYTCTLADGNTKATFVSADPAKPIQQVKCVQVTFAVPKAPTNGYFQYTIPADGSSTFSMKAICYPGYTVKLTSPSKSNVYTVNGQRTTISPTIAAQPLPTCVPSTRRRLLEFLER